MRNILSLASLLAGSAAAMAMPEISLSNTDAPSKRSAGDKAHRAFNKTRLYRPNGARECARRARQAAALQSKATA